MKTKQLVRLVVTVASLVWLWSEALAAPGVPPAAPAGAVVPTDLTPKAKRPNWVRKADKGFFDDAMAIDPQNGLVALIRTDSASFADLEMFDLVKKSKVTSFPLGSAQDIFERIEFTGQGRSVVVVVQDSKTGQRVAQRFDNEGKPAGLVGPAADIGFATRGNQRLIVKWDRAQNKKGQNQFLISTFDLANLSPVGKTQALPTDGLDRITKPPLTILSWTDGYTQIFGQEPGGFDKAKDMRIPDRAALFDVLKGDMTWRGDIADVVAWSGVNQLRRRRPGRSVFAEVAEDQSRLDIVNGIGLRAGTKLAVPFEMYDLRSLMESESPSEGSFFFSLTVDPLNPPALEKKKADIPKLDVYRLPIPPLGSPTVAEFVPQLILRAPMDDRPVKWMIAGPWIVILRKFKSFARGGEVLEIYNQP
jgi:hypothetical protein